MMIMMMIIIKIIIIIIGATGTISKQFRKYLRNKPGKH
jgi:RNase P/RNase MRP subunit POP5